MRVCVCVCVYLCVRECVCSTNYCCACTFLLVCAFIGSALKIHKPDDVLLSLHWTPSPQLACVLRTKLHTSAAPAAPLLHASSVKMKCRIIIDVVIY